MNQAVLKRYAQLAVKVGVNLQPGQNLIIGYGIRQVLPEHLEFARALIEAGYEAGAKFVEVDYGDEWWQRETVQRGALSTFEARAKWKASWIEHLAREGAASIGIPSADPDLYHGMDLQQVTSFDRATASAFRAFNDKRTNHDYSWTLISAPTQAWADKVFPNMDPASRLEALWKAILYTARADSDNPVGAWQSHLKALKERTDWINRMRIKKLHYKAPGTDLVVELPPTHFWTSAEDETPEGVIFVANMPTEEVYSVPLKTGVNGVVSSTMPLNHNGNLIDGICLRFEHGRIVEYSATTGQDALANIIETDEGSHYLGEIALVPDDSPISNLGLLFYNTLFDENASCHLAIGKAYPLIEGGNLLASDKWEEHGLNRSLMHVDFMIGSKEMDIDVETQDGQRLPLMKSGNWVS